MKIHTIKTYTTAAAFALLQLPVAALADDTATTQAILDHHLQAFGTGNMEEFLSDYTDTSVVMVPGAQFVGPDQFEPVVQGLFEEFGKEGMTFNMIDSYVQDNVAYIVWSAETADNSWELATDTFVIKDGKIAYQTFAAKVVPKE